MVIVAQLVRAPDCGSGGREFESRLSPLKTAQEMGSFFCKLRKIIIIYNTASLDSILTAIIFL